MSQRKKKWSAQKKLAIALEALQGEATIAQVCQSHQVSPSQVHAWKKQLQEKGAQLFDSKAKNNQQKALERLAIERSRLYEKVGQLTMERDFLKKALEKPQHLIDED